MTGHEYRLPELEPKPRRHALCDVENLPSRFTAVPTLKGRWGCVEWEAHEQAPALDLGDRALPLKRSIGTISPAPARLAEGRAWAVRGDVS